MKWFRSSRIPSFELYIIIENYWKAADATTPYLPTTLHYIYISYEYIHIYVYSFNPLLLSPFCPQWRVTNSLSLSFPLVLAFKQGQNGYITERSTREALLIHCEPINGPTTLGPSHYHPTSSVHPSRFRFTPFVIQYLARTINETSTQNNLKKYQSECLYVWISLSNLIYFCIKIF